MCSGEHILMKGKSEKRAICTASAVLPHPTGPTININTVNLDNVHTTPEKLILKTLLISTVGSTIHTYPSRRRSLSKTLFRPEEFENTALFLRFNLLPTVIRHENGAIRKRSFNRRNLKTPASKSVHTRGLVEGTRFGDQSHSVYCVFCIEILVAGTNVLAPATSPTN